MTCHDYIVMQVVEGEPECFEKVVENGVQVPEETCSMEPTTECKNVTVRSVIFGGCRRRVFTFYFAAFQTLFLKKSAE